MRLFRARWLVLISALMPIAVASAEVQFLAPNARVTGDIAQLEQYADAIGGAPCAGPRCLFSIPRTILNVTAPGEGRWRVILDKAKFSRNVRRVANGEVVDDVSTRPVHFRGFAAAQGHAGGSSRTVVTLFRHGGDSKGEKYFEINLDRGSPRRNLAFGSFVVRFSTGGATNRRLNARSQRAAGAFVKTLQCGTVAAPHSDSPVAASASTSPITSRATTESFNVIRLATDFDAQFAARCTSCNNEIETYVERAAAIYETQFGYTLTVSSQFGPNTSLGVSTNSNTALEEFRNFNNNNRSGLATDLYTLVTGRTMQESVIGLAYVGVTCQVKSFSALLIQDVVSSLNHIILAHEVGHTLNAAHTTSGIMGTALNPSSPPTSFNATSVNQISSYVEANYPGRSCTGGTSSGSPSPTPTPMPTPTPTRTPTRTPTSTPIGGGGTQPSPTAIPTPVPTGTSGGVSGPGSEPGGTRETLVLTATIQASGIVSLTSTVTMLTPGCEVQIRVGGTDYKAVFGTLVGQYIPTSESSTLTGTVPFRIQRTKQGTNVFAMGQYFCPASGKVIEQSAVIRFSPNRAVQGRTKAIPKGRYIRALARGLTLQ